MTVREEIKKIIEDGFKLKKCNPIYQEIITIDDKRIYTIPLWTFLMCVNIFEYFIKNNKIVTFYDILYLDTYSSGHIDYDRTLLYAAEKLFYGN